MISPRKLVWPLLLLAVPASAQQFTMPPPVGVTVMGVRVVSSCGAETYTAGSKPAFAEMDTTGAFCVAANVTASASITGFPGSAQSTGTPISVTTSATAGTLPAGTVVVASNIGSTNTAICKLGNAATVNDQPIPPNSWFAFTVGTNTQITCVTSAAATTVNLVGGSGVPTGAGGGGGGGGTSGTASTVDPTTPARWALGATGAATPVSAFYVGISSSGTLSGWNGAVTQQGVWASRTQDGAGNAISSDTRGAKQPMAVEILDGSGNQITSFGGSGGTASNFGSTFPTAGTAAGVQSGAFMVPMQTDGLSNLQVNVKASTPEGVLGAAAGCTSGSSNTMVQCLYQLHSDVTGPIPAGTNAIGTVDPSTPGRWALGATAAAVPASAFYMGINVGGNLTGWNGSVTLSPGSVGIGTVDPTTPARWGIGATAAAVPASAFYVGILAGGNLIGWGGSVVLSPGTAAVGTVDPSTPARWAYGATGAAVPTTASYVGINVAGNLTGWNGSVVLSPGTAAVGTVDPSTPARWALGATGAAVPASAFYAGINVGGNLTGWNGSVVLSPGTAAVGTVDPTTPARWGLGATAAAVPASAFYVAGQAINAEPTKATNGNLIGGSLDLTGKFITSPYANRENQVRGEAAASGTTSTQLIAAGAAGVKNYITDIECARNDAGTTAIFVTFTDTVSTVMVLPNSGSGGGNNKAYNTPLVTAAAAPFNFVVSAATTSVYCACQGFQGY